MIKIALKHFDYDEKTKTLSKPVAGAWDVSFATIIRAAMLVGRKSMFEVFQFGELSKIELRWRSAIIRANVVELDDIDPAKRRLVPTPAFQALDGSEKTAVSYLLGQAAAKLMAERHCSIPWVMHLDVYANPKGAHTAKWYEYVKVKDATGRPDLIGQDFAGRWAVIEAKGRSGAADDKLRKSSKEQTRTLSTINGVDPYWRLAAIGQLKASGLEIDIIDPPDALDDAFPLNISPDLFIYLAYRTVVDLLIQATPEFTSIRGYSFRVLYLTELDMTIGLKADVFDILVERKPFDPTVIAWSTGSDSKFPRIKEALANLPPIGLDGDGEGFAEFSIGPDGTLVGLGPSWKKDLGYEVKPLPPLYDLLRTQYPDLQWHHDAALINNSRELQDYWYLRSYDLIEVEHLKQYE